MAGATTLVKTLPYWAKHVATSYLDNLDDLVPFLKGTQQNLIRGGSKVNTAPTNIASTPTPVYFDPKQKNLLFDKPNIPNAIPRPIGSVPNTNPSRNLQSLIYDKRLAPRGEVGTSMPRVVGGVTNATPPRSQVSMYLQNQEALAAARDLATAGRTGRSTPYNMPLKGQGDLFGAGGTQVATTPAIVSPLPIGRVNGFPKEVLIDKFGKRIEPFRNIAVQKNIIPPYDGYSPLSYSVDALGNVVSSVVDDVARVADNAVSYIPNSIRGALGNVVDDVGRVVSNAGAYIPSSLGGVVGKGLGAFGLYSAAARDVNEDYGWLDAAGDAATLYAGPAVTAASLALTPSSLGNSDRYINGVLNPKFSNSNGRVIPSVARPQQIQPAVVQAVPTRQIQPAVVQAVPTRQIQAVPTRRVSQVTQPQVDTSFLNLTDAMDNAGIYPDYRGMSASDALALANQRVDAQVAAYNQPVQIQQPVNYNEVLQAQAQQMRQLQQQEQSRFFEERPENMFWDPLTERYVTSREFYN